MEQNVWKLLGTWGLPSKKLSLCSKDEIPICELFWCGRVGLVFSDINMSNLREDGDLFDKIGSNNPMSFQKTKNGDLSRKEFF